MGPIDARDPLGDGATRPLSQEMMRHQRLLHLMKVQLSSAVQDGLDWGALTLLAHLVKGGPRRQGELAEGALLDASTVSRRVSLLVARGFVERQPDPVDGRAVLLAATDAGQAVYDEVRTRHENVLGQILADWDPADLTTFLALLGRLNDDVEAALPYLPSIHTAGDTSRKELA